MLNNLFVWDEEKKIGYYPVKDTWYNDLYYDASVRNSQSPIAKMLNEFRARIINKYVEGKILDFGAGCGALLDYRDNTVGYDICPKSIEMLKARGLFYDFYHNDLDKEKIKGISFFDVIEHIRYPKTVLNQINGQHVIASVPIFKDKNHALTSKHFKINEHFWYFTDHSFIDLMESCGFHLLERTNEETKIGREDIYTYVFKKTKCESCFWYASPRLSIDIKKYGMNKICLNAKSGKNRIKKTDLVCPLFLEKDMRWDNNKYKFVHIDEWKPMEGN